MNENIDQLLEIQDTSSTELKKDNNKTTETTTIKKHSSQFWIGLLLLIPPILGVIAFCLCLFDVNSDFVELRNLGPNWTGYHGDGGYTSAAPIYLGLMAIAGAYLIKDKK